MQVKGACIAEIIKLEEYLEHTLDPLIQTVSTHQRNRNSVLFQTATNFKKSLQGDTYKWKHSSPEPEGKVGSIKAAWTIST
jgi:hypothetical protein